MALVLITHDMGVVAETADRVWAEAERVRDATTSVYTHAAGGDPIA